MSMIDDIKRDREEGTPGPWDALETDQGGAGADAYVAVDDGSDVVAKVRCYTARGLNRKPFEANARRIARVPDMEARILRDAEIIAAADELVEVLCEPVATHVDLKWRASRNAALAAYAKAKETGQ